MDKINLERYREICVVESNKSPANKRKVGAVIFDLKTGRIKATGHNKSMFGSRIPCESDIGKTFEHVQHAEEAAILSLIGSDCLRAQEYVILCTYTPCYNCSKLIVASGVIGTVIYIDKHKHNFDVEQFPGNLTPEALLIANGIFVYKYDDIK